MLKSICRGISSRTPCKRRRGHHYPMTSPSDFYYGFGSMVRIPSPDPQNMEGLHKLFFLRLSFYLQGLPVTLLASTSITKHIFHTINLGARLPKLYYVRFHRRLLLSPYLGTHVRHLRLVDVSEDDDAHEISWITHPRAPISRTLGFLLNLRSFGSSFNSTEQIGTVCRMKLRRLLVCLGWRM
jgi:hypothetical protein